MNSGTSAAARNDTQPRDAGLACRAEPFVYVRWGWLAFPAAMVAASFGLLIATIWRSHRQKRHRVEG
jgi:hypothetical protein